MTTRTIGVQVDGKTVGTVDVPESDITESPTEAPRPDTERMDHARMLLADRYGADVAAWLALRWCRVLVLLGEGDRRAVLSALHRHVSETGDAEDLRAFSQIASTLEGRP